MHQATIQALSGMVGIIRQALTGIEAIVGAEANTALVKQDTLRENSASSGQESKYLTAEEEEIAAKIFGITHE
jgi:hypothetical protein